MKRSVIFLVAILLLSLVITITVTSIASTLAAPDPNKPIVVQRDFVRGIVILQLPPPSNASAPAAPGTPSHPTNLVIGAMHTGKKSTFGAHDSLYLGLWIPVANGYIPVAEISDNGAAGQNWYQVYWNNTPAFSNYSNPAWSTYFKNVIPVADNELQVWTENGGKQHDDDGFKGCWNDGSSSTLIVNLTRSVFISLPWNIFNNIIPFLAAYGNQSFILPPMTLTFHEIGDSFYEEDSSSLIGGVAPSVPYSGYTVKETGWSKPSWVEVSIPSWVNFATLDVTGKMSNKGTSTYIPPA